MDDSAEEWLTTFGAALERSIHFGMAMSRLAHRAHRARAKAKDVSLDGLSAREREVLDLTREGLMPAEIARRLGRSIKTVEAHYERVKTTLSLGSIAALRAQLTRDSDCGEAADSLARGHGKRGQRGPVPGDGSFLPLLSVPICVQLSLQQSCPTDLNR